MSVFDWLLIGALSAASFVLIRQRNWLRLAFSFFALLFLAAVVYMRLGAFWVGLTHLVLYVGGILILQLFGMMFTQRSIAGQTVGGTRLLFPLVFVSLLAVAGFVSLGDSLFASSAWLPKTVTLFSVGKLMMSDWLMAFELVSLLLLVALIGAAHISRLSAHSK